METLIVQNDSNATDISYLISQSSPTFIAAVSSSLNMGKWDNSAEDIAGRVCNSVKLLKLLGLVHGDITCNVEPVDPQPAEEGKEYGCVYWPKPPADCNANPPSPAEWIKNPSGGGPCQSDCQKNGTVCKRDEGTNDEWERVDCSL